jgi:proteasome accessory factor A
MADFQTKLSKPIPSLKDITAACNRFAMDWMLLAKEPGRQRRPWSATDLQKFYLLETRRFLEASPGEVSNEAWKILEIWQTTLNQLSGSDELGEPSEDLVGRIDWITKLWLLNQLDQNANRKTKRKLDLLYHELSREGYGTRVLEMQKEKSFVSENAILRAMGNPPRDSIAVARSYIIREFGDLETQLELDWDRARWRFEGKKHSVRFEVS